MSKQITCTYEFSIVIRNPAQVCVSLLIQVLAW